ncbi:hypothetical protein [Archangium lipolyticum]|uniref:hypothetical protein n=1 Tax=Archangium lipolyticum TaxID=2970465 RepID=UPI002149FB7B|nr:hypothetical protein [Archangium lipolyticum]
MVQTNGGNTLSELTLEQVADSIRTYLRQGNAGHYNIGLLYNHTVDNQLAEKNGYESAQAYFSQHFEELSQATLTRYGTVAREFTEEACGMYGVMKLITLRTYLQVAELQFAAGEPGATPIDVPEEGGIVKQKPFAECSLEELRQAVKHKRNPTRATMPTTDADRVEFMRQCFSRHFAKGTRVQLKTNFQRGKTLLTIQGVPLDDVERLMEALMDGFQPQLVRSAG